MSKLSSRMEAVQTPIIPVIGKLIGEYPGTISLGQGVVSYPPPPCAIAQISQFLSEPSNHQYQPVEGLPQLIQAIGSKLETENHLHQNEQTSVVVTAGANMAFLNALLAITNAGDEIILPLPYYFNHEMAVTMANCHPVLVDTDENYQLMPAAIAEAITSKTRAVVTVSPNNPTGVVYPRQDLEAVNQICKEYGIYHICDQTYEYFTYDGLKAYSPASRVGSHNHTITLFSLSKAYGFASWRIGYMVIPQHLLLAVKKIQDTNLICPPVISQYAAIGALEAGKSYCLQQIQTIVHTRNIVRQQLQAVKDICTVAPSQGAFYFFLRVDSDLNDLELATRLIQDYRVATIPGSTFGLQNGCYLRIAYGCLHPQTAAAGIERLVTGLHQLVKK